MWATPGPLGAACLHAGLSEAAAAERAGALASRPTGSSAPASTGHRAQCAGRGTSANTADAPPQPLNAAVSGPWPSGSAVAAQASLPDSMPQSAAGVPDARSASPSGACPTSGAAGLAALQVQRALRRHAAPAPPGRFVTLAGEDVEPALGPSARVRAHCRRLSDRCIRMYSRLELPLCTERVSDWEHGCLADCMKLLPVPATFKVSELECAALLVRTEALPASQGRCRDSDSALTGASPRARLQDGAAAPAEHDQGEPMPRPASACDAAAGAAADRPAMAAAAPARPLPAAADGVAVSAGARPPAEGSRAASAGQAARRGLKRKLGPPGVVTAAMARRKRARRGSPPRPRLCGQVITILRRCSRPRAAGVAVHLSRALPKGERAAAVARHSGAPAAKRCSTMAAG